MIPVLEGLSLWQLKISTKVHDMVMGDRQVTERYCWDFSGKSSFHSYGRSGYEKTHSPLGTQTSDS